MERYNLTEVDIENYATQEEKEYLKEFHFMAFKPESENYKELILKFMIDKVNPNFNPNFIKITEYDKPVIEILYNNGTGVTIMRKLKRYLTKELGHDNFILKYSNRAY